MLPLMGRLTISLHIFFRANNGAGLYRIPAHTTEGRESPRHVASLSQS